MKLYAKKNINMTNNIKIKKGDTVKVLYGKERGKRGTVVAIDPKKGRVIVEGLNLYKKHIKGDGRTRTSEVVTVEMPFYISKVMLVCPLCDKPTRVALRQEGKSKIRVCKECEKDIVEKKEIKKETEQKNKKTEVKKTKSESEKTVVKKTKSKSKK
jgi:large subunit ribosomal protein L24